MAESTTVAVTEENRDQVLEAGAREHAEHADKKAQFTAGATPTDEPAESPEKSSETPDQEEVSAEAEESEEETETEEAEEAEEAAESADGEIDYQAYYTEFMDSGTLSPESRAPIEAKLTEAGLPTQLLDEYLAGVSARLVQGEQQAFDLVGGQEQYTAMQTWARENYSQEQADAFDVAVSNPQTAELAIKGLYADFKASGSAAPRSLRAKGGTTQQGLAPISSNKELVDIMMSERYKTDKVYRDEIDDRLRQSPLLRG
jgi:hypothetical protein